MKIILIKDVENLGNAGDIKEVKSGHARNFLIPNKLAIQFTEGKLKSLNQKIAEEERKINRDVKNISKVLKQIAELTFEATVKTGEDDKVFGSITKQDLVDFLGENGISLDKKNLDLVSPIKTIGEHSVPVVFTADLKGELKVICSKEII
jgi:large subunit ribosomal protein L9